MALTDSTKDAAALFTLLKSKSISLEQALAISQARISFGKILASSAMAESVSKKLALSKFNLLVNLSEYEELISYLHQFNISAFSIFDDCYPLLLRQIHDPPSVIFYQGNLQAFNLPGIAIVGSRKISAYGKACTNSIASYLSFSKCAIISGLAYGVDAQAHESCLLSQGCTIAVLGSGLDYESLYPKNNYKLAQQIINQDGLLLSEYPPKTSPRKQYFIARNRIIAGLSLGVCVTECLEKSGALITADFAVDFNRSVFAVPGQILSPASGGPHTLIKQGACLVSKPEDILNELGLNPSIQNKPNKKSGANNQKTFSSNPMHQRVLEMLSNQTQIDTDTICQELNLSAQQAASILAELELAGLIKK